MRFVIDGNGPIEPAGRAYPISQFSSISQPVTPMRPNTVATLPATFHHIDAPPPSAPAPIIPQPVQPGANVVATDPSNYYVDPGTIPTPPDIAPPPASPASVASVPASSSSIDPVIAWLESDSVISSIPNWWLVGGVVLAGVLFGGKRGRR